jgi:hypothetical protein
VPFSFTGDALSLRPPSETGRAWVGRDGLAIPRGTYWTAIVESVPDFRPRGDRLSGVSWPHSPGASHNPPNPAAAGRGKGRPQVDPVGTRSALPATKAGGTLIGVGRATSTASPRGRRLTRD